MKHAYRTEIDTEETGYLLCTRLLVTRTVCRYMYASDFIKKTQIIVTKWEYNVTVMVSFQTGAKIIIRGKGSVKEGKIGRKDGQPLPGEDEPLHAYVTANNPENVQKAVDKVRSRGQFLEKQVWKIKHEHIRLGF